MGKLIDQLVEDHKRLELALESVSSVETPSEKGRASLLSLKSELFSHFRKEDEVIFPGLEELESRDIEAKKAVGNFRAIKELLPRLEMIFDEYAAGRDVYGMPLCDVFSSLRTQLTIRFRREEEILYRLYAANQGVIH